MKSRHLIIIIVVLYALAALCMLGVGNVREELKALPVEEAVPIVEPAPVPAPAPSPGLAGTDRKDLQNKLVLWQILTLGTFAAASLLLIYREKLTKKAAPPVE